jgi:succinate dehydrogenase / fumarate reductase cytochrome b subunit
VASLSGANGIHVMNLISRIWDSSLGKKYIMALTGAALFAFTVGHLVGNLQVFGPPELINTYGHFLKSKPTLLWAVRLGLLACVGLHIAAAVTLTALNKAARPAAYAARPTYGSTFASRTMLVSGLIILAFVLYHLAHFTVLLPAVNGVGDFRGLEATLPGGEKTHDVYAMMVIGFQVWWVVVFYLIAQGLLFLHLGHGLASMFQSLGWRNHVWWPRVQALARIVSVALLAGYAIIPIAIYLRLVGADYAEKKRYELRTMSQPPVAVTASAGKEAK